MYYICIDRWKVHRHELKNFKVMTRNSQTRSNATRNENTNAANKQQVKNRKSSNAPAPETGTPVPAKLEELEARLTEKTTALNEVKKQSQKLSEKLAKAREDAANQRYCVAVSRQNLGTATEDDLAIIASRKASDNTDTGLAKFFAKEFKETEAETKAWESLRGELGSVSSAIAETKRLWNKGFNALYKSIGITNMKSLTPDLLKGLCPFMQVAAADGLKAALPGQRAVKKIGKAVKRNGKRVYKYTLRAVGKWNAETLYRVLRDNYRMTTSDLFTADELKTRLDLLNAEVSALKALKAAAEAKKSDVPEQAADAAKAEDELKAAAKAAGRKAKENAATAGSKAIEEPKKVVNG